MLILFSLLIGLWVVWKELLPAFRSVLDITLWTYSASVDNITKLLPVTLGNVITAIVTIVITIIVTKNLPGILEIAVLKRLRMEQGSRYAFTSIFRYTIVGLGVIVISNTIGLNWYKLQWLIAALGVGLGFGLQEVVANFICGLVILFERPFQVGDVVTVGETSGTVTRIRIRATTITDWDRHELIVPNKEFITGKLFNWTLSDPVERIVIPVGIGHGSDTALAERVLLKVARENPMVLTQPEPSALFLGIKENSLQFELRVFVHGVDKRLPATHQLHQSVDSALKEAGIPIASPKRDVHFSSKNAVDVRVVSEKGEEED
jgi:potassium efflux system protein